MKLTAQPIIGNSNYRHLSVLFYIFVQTEKKQNATVNHTYCLNLVSSANSLTVTPLGTSSQISLTYKINNTGPSTLPWGTLFVQSLLQNHILDVGSLFSHTLLILEVSLLLYFTLYVLTFYVIPLNKCYSMCILQYT